MANSTLFNLIIFNANGGFEPHEYYIHSYSVSARPSLSCLMPVLFHYDYFIYIIFQRKSSLSHCHHLSSIPLMVYDTTLLSSVYALTRWFCITSQIHSCELPLVGKILVERIGIEPINFCLQGKIVPLTVTPQ
jgi:hypothetical protein